MPTTNRNKPEQTGTNRNKPEQSGFLMKVNHKPSFTLKFISKATIWFFLTLYAGFCVSTMIAGCNL
jgi:hypothetical protein